MPIVQKIKNEKRNYMSDKFDKNQLLTLADLPISRTTAWRLIRRGKLRCYRLNRRVFFVSEGMIVHQLTRALLGMPPTTTTGESQQPIQVIKRDLDQERAAQAGEKEAADGRRAKTVLVDAGPGTGKTRTLIERVSHLLTKRNVSASQILALTFSNKAAEEIYVRVQASAAKNASQVWTGTFHKFGLDLIRKYHSKVGVSPTPKVIDMVDAQLLLEQNLAKLGLRHYRSLYKPTLHLRGILSAISLAKDYLIEPAKYAELTAKNYQNAETENELKKAEKAMEVARVYKVYQVLLQKNDFLDYGDLLLRSVKLLAEHDDVRGKLQAQYQHILVDEYQDVNDASRILLKFLAGNGSGLWVVGDLRQAIYRFRGASPTNMLLLTTEDFPDAEIIKLNTNYRSQSPIVDAFTACAKEMNVAQTEEKWEVHRENEGAEIRYLISSDEKAEAVDLVEEIERLKTANVEFRDQAVLCRLHNDLMRLSDALETAGIPVLYLGNFFERPEVRDLLSIVAMASEPNGRALYRLANFDEYGFSYKDIKILTNYVFENQLRFPLALNHLSKVKDLSSEGKTQLQLLAKHFENFHFGNTAWHVLSQYLFAESDYLRLLIADDTVQGQQKRLAVYQLLLFAYQLREQFAEQDGDSKRHFLNYVRHLKLNGEDKQLRQTPDWADEINAVRMMTIHAAKGLEWSAVHLPTLSEGKFPGRNFPPSCPPPSEMLPKEAVGWQDDEEKCLFFVGLSRAQNYLNLYRAREYDYKTRQPSRLLKPIENMLLPAICRPPQQAGPPPPRQTNLIKFKREYTERQLSVYLECPLQYYYRFVLEIHSSRSETPVGKTHLCVYQVSEAIKREETLGHAVTKEFVEEKIAEVWAERGPVEHPYEADYQIEAREMIQRIFERSPMSEDRIIQPEWRVELENGIVIVKPDYVEFFDDNGKMRVVVERLNFDKKPDEIEKDIYVLFDVAAAQTYPEFRKEVKAAYMTDGTTVTLSIDNNWRKNALKNYNKAILGISAENSAPHVDGKKCPVCPDYFNCPSKKR